MKATNPKIPPSATNNETETTDIRQELFSLALQELPIGSLLKFFYNNNYSSEIEELIKQRKQSEKDNAYLEHEAGLIRVIQTLYCKWFFGISRSSTKNLIKEQEAEAEYQGNPPPINPNIFKLSDFNTTQYTLLAEEIKNTINAIINSSDDVATHLNQFPDLHPIYTKSKNNEAALDCISIDKDLKQTKEGSKKEHLSSPRNLVKAVTLLREHLEKIKKSNLFNEEARKLNNTPVTGLFEKLYREVGPIRFGYEDYLIHDLDRRYQQQLSSSRSTLRAKVPSKFFKRSDNKPAGGNTAPKEKKPGESTNQLRHLHSMTGLSLPKIPKLKLNKNNGNTEANSQQKKEDKGKKKEKKKLRTRARTAAPTLADKEKKDADINPSTPIKKPKSNKKLAKENNELSNLLQLTQAENKQIRRENFSNIGKIPTYTALLLFLNNDLFHHVIKDYKNYNKSRWWSLRHGKKGRKNANFFAEQWDNYYTSKNFDVVNEFTAIMQEDRATVDDALLHCLKSLSAEIKSFIAANLLQSANRQHSLRTYCVAYIKFIDTLTEQVQQQIEQIPERNLQKFITEQDEGKSEKASNANHFFDITNQPLSTKKLYRSNHQFFKSMIKNNKSIKQCRELYKTVFNTSSP